MKAELLVCKIEEYLNKNILIEKRAKENKQTSETPQKAKRCESDDKGQKKVK